MYTEIRYGCVFARAFVCDLKLSGSIQRHSQTAEQDYGTTGCGCTLPQGFCFGGERLMQYFFITALLEIQCLHNNVLFFFFLILWMRLILKSLEAISTQFTMLCRLEQ